MSSMAHPLVSSLAEAAPGLGPGLTLLAWYGLVIAVLAAYATHVSLSNADPARRADAYKVLKLVWGTATGTTGVVAAALHLTGHALL